MTNYHISLHYLSSPNYEDTEDIWADVLAEAYNNALECIWKTELSFFDESESELFWVEYYANETYKKIFEIKGCREIWDNTYCSVRINFDDIPEDDIDRFQEKFLSDLKGMTRLIYKFEDSRFLEIRKQLFEDIYKVETSLREAMSFVFLITYYDFGDFLRDLKVGDITGKLWLTQDDLRNRLENEFFYISFKDYANLLELRPIKELKSNHIENLITDSRTFDDWKRRIADRGVHDEPYVLFVESIKQDLSCLEKIRNSVMHNRYFNPELKREYEKSRDSIFEKTREFRENHIHLSGNCWWLVPWEKYQCIQDAKYFRKWESYQLAEIICWDYYFIWEDGEKQCFFNKELLEYFNR